MRVLVEVDELLVAQDAENLVADSGQLGTDDERTLERRPQRKVRATLLKGQVAVAHLEHVPVIVSPEARVAPVPRRLVDDGHQAPAVVVLARPLGVDVSPHAPVVARLVAPALDVGVAPGAEGVLDDAVLLEEGVAHGVVAHGGQRVAVVVAWGRLWVVEEGWVVLVVVQPLLGDIAVVILEVFTVLSVTWDRWRGMTQRELTIDTPFSKSGSVYLFIAERSRESSASGSSYRQRSANSNRETLCV